MIKNLVVTAVLLCQFCYAHTQDRYKYEVKKVSNDIYVLEPVINEYRWVTANIVVIINDNDVFVVDSGLLPSAAEEAIKEIRKLTTKPVKYLLNTHWHGDHWQGNEVFAKEFPNIKIIASEKNKAAIERNGVVWVNNFYPLYLNMMVGGLEGTLKEENEKKEKTLNETEKKTLEQGINEIKADMEEVKTIKPVFPNTTFKDKMVINAGKRKIELHYLGPGNTIGDAVVFLPNEKILIAGDLVVHPSPYESGAFSYEWVETSRKLAASFKYQKLIPGHGYVQNDTIYLSYLNDLYNEIVKQVDKAYRSGKPQLADVQTVVTHASVVKELNKNSAYKKYTQQLGDDFVPAAVKNCFSAVIQGKFVIR